MGATAAEHGEAPTGASEDRVRVGTSVREILVRLWPYFMRRKLAFVISIGAVCTGAVCGRLAILLFGRVIDLGISRGDRSFILYATGGFFVLQAVGAAMEYVQSYVFASTLR